jgi:2-deoxy-D-gluconate 3-dehydrogenase
LAHFFKGGAQRCGRNTMLGLSGKRALIIGGGRGMGEASALMLAEGGADIAIVDMELERAETVAASVAGLGRKSYAIVANVLQDEKSVNAAVAEAEQKLGGIDILVTIVGQAMFKPLLDMTAEDWDFDQNRNLRYVFFAARAAAASMIKRKAPGAIVCIASVDGLIGSPGHAAYGAAKAGLVSLVKSMSAEWGRDNIRVNAVAPGSITTPRLPETPQSLAIMENSVVPLGRPGTVKEIAGAVTFLASDMASYVTGQTLAVDGGWTASNIFDPRIFQVKKSNG